MKIFQKRLQICLHWNLFWGLYSGLFGSVFSPEGAEFYGDYDYPIKAVFKIVSNRLHWFGAADLVAIFGEKPRDLYLRPRSYNKKHLFINCTPLLSIILLRTSLIRLKKGYDWRGWLQGAVQTSKVYVIIFPFQTQTPSDRRLT